MLFCVCAFGNQEEIKTVSLHTEAVAHRAFERESELAEWWIVGKLGEV